MKWARPRTMLACMLLAVLSISLWAPVSLAASGGQGTTVAETYREAYDVGYDDGRKAGNEDRLQSRMFDPANKREFQQADNGLDSSRHDREVYLVAYRRGFEDGYEEGYGLSEAVDTSSPLPKPESDDSVDTPVPVSVDIPRRVPGVSSRIPAGTQLQIELRNTLSTKYSERGDDFRARVLDDVFVDQTMVIPMGTEIRGEISFLKRPGRIRGRAQMNLRFDELRLPDGRYTFIEAKVVELEPRSAEKVRKKNDEGTIIAPGSKGADVKRVGKSSGIGALIGVLGGGKSGAAVGAGAGAVGGLASILLTRGRDAVLETGTEMTIELMQDVELPGRP